MSLVDGRRTPVAAVRALVAPHALDVLRAAEGGDAAAGAASSSTRQRLLCAHREGPYGVRHWNTQVERWLGEETGEPIWSTWYAGRPLLVTANDYGARHLQRRRRRRGAAARGERRAARCAPRSTAAPGASTSPPAGVAQVETMHALTIHKSQGSQADEVW